MPTYERSWLGPMSLPPDLLWFLLGLASMFLRNLSTTFNLQCASTWVFSQAQT